MQALILTLFGDGVFDSEAETVTFKVTEILRFVRVVRVTINNRSTVRVDAGDLVAVCSFDTLLGRGVDPYDDEEVVRYLAENGYFSEEA